MKFLLETSAVVLVGLSMNWLSGSPGPDLSDVVLRPTTEAAPTAQVEAKKPLAVDWQTLRELDYHTGEKSSAIAQLVSAGVIVRIPGFMIPLEDAADAITEFLLIPYPMACVHVPPPPPNQMISNSNFDFSRGSRLSIDTDFAKVEISQAPRRPR